MNDVDLLSNSLKLGVTVAIGIFIAAVILFILFFIEYKRRLKMNEERNSLATEELLVPSIAFFHEIGKRESQQDSYYISPMDEYRKNGLVAVVADGMGGLKYGDEISDRIISRIEEMTPLSFHATEIIVEELTKLSNDIYDKYRMHGGSTLAMIQIYRNYFHFYTAGDSEVILIRNGEATVLNQRQKYVTHLVRRMAKSGNTTYEAYVNKEARALVDFIGNNNPRILHTAKPIRLVAGDTIVICSDGLTDILPWRTLPQYTKGSARKAAENLKRNIKLKNHPKQDNYTGIVIKISRDTI